jgi:hypothetical protein
MTEINTVNRVKKVCELLQEAVSVGGLDAATRVDVAARGARLCLDGVQVSINMSIELWSCPLYAFAESDLSCSSVYTGLPMEKSHFGSCQAPS